MLELTTAPLSHKKNTSEEAVFVIQGLKWNLFGLLANQGLQFISRVNTNSVDQDVQNRYANLFRELGDLYQIQLKEDAQPHGFYRVCIDLKPLNESVL